jgi:hypothetical protein
MLPTMATSNALKEMWLTFAHEAAEQIAVPEDVEDTDEVADYMVEVATKFADSMLDEYEKRWGDGGTTRKRRKKKSKIENDDDDDDDDD